MRIGLIVPSSNTVMEEELRSYVAVNATRISLKKVDEHSLKKMNEELSKAFGLVADCNPDVIVYGCTSGSFIEDVITPDFSIPVVTTSEAVLSALQVLQVKTVSVAAPYIEEIMQREKEFLETHFTVTDMKGLGLLTNTDIGDQPDEAAYNLAKTLKRADAIFISCTNFRTFNIINDLEAELKVPVVSSNSAVLWSALKLTHTRGPIHLGRLLEEYL
jgi:maleate isomerase